MFKSAQSILHTLRHVARVAAVCGAWPSTSAARETLRSEVKCKSDQHTIFFCQTESHENVSICLAHDSTISIERELLGSSPRLDLGQRIEEFIGETSPHGSNVTLRITSESDVTTVFVSLDPYDMAPATIVTTNGQTEVEKCTLGSQRTKAGTFFINGKLRNVRLPGLERLGLAVHLTNPPAWPR